MKMISRLIALGSFLVLAGCGTWTAESYLHEDIQGDSFNACLAREYQDRATSEAYVDCNWVDTAAIVAKGRAAAAGETVLPYDPATKGVLPSDLPELQDARSKLMAALDNGGRTDRGCACAKAQRYYDGWVEQASDNKLGVNGSYFGGEGGPVQPDRVTNTLVGLQEIIRAPLPGTMQKHNERPRLRRVIVVRYIQGIAGRLTIHGYGLVEKSRGHGLAAETPRRQTK